MNEERWLPIPGYEGIYEISSLGRVKRLARITVHSQNGGSRSLGERMLTLSKNNGYLVAYLGGNGRTKKNANKIYIEAAIEHLFGIKQNLPDTAEDGEWRDIPGYEDLYQVSSLGKVRSIGRHVKSDCSIHVNLGAKRRYIRPRMLPGGPGTTGYMKVELSARGVIRTLMIHRLVALTFIPNPLGLEVVHHRDENKLNNRVENLEWVSKAGNVQDWFDRRRIVVSTDTIEAIAAALSAGKSPAEILAALPRKRKKRHMGDG